ncbi:MAG: hypothetical protein JWN96_78 [Mycobacterium sp.]|nr:hypothetical protein [Mycobacterium sp.]
MRPACVVGYEKDASLLPTFLISADNRHIACTAGALDAIEGGVDALAGLSSTRLRELGQPAAWLPFWMPHAVRSTMTNATGTTALRHTQSYTFTFHFDCRLLT